MISQNQELIKEFKNLLDEFQSINIEKENNKKLSELFLIYSELFNFYPSLFIMDNKNVSSCNKIDERLLFSFKEKKFKKKIIGVNLIEQNFLNYIKLNSNIIEGDFSISCSIKNDILKQDYILSLNNNLNNYKSIDLIGFAYYLHKIKFGKLYINNDKIFNVEISLLGLDFNYIKFSELFVLKLMLNQNEILKHLRIKILNVNQDIILKDADIKFSFDLKTFDFDGKFKDVCEFNNVLLLNHFKDNFSPINYKVYQGKYCLLVNKYNIYNPSLYSIDNIYYIKNRSKQAMYSRTINMIGDFDNNSYEFRYPNQISFEFKFNDVNEFNEITIFGEGYWQQNLSDINFSDLIGKDVNNELSDFSFFKLKSSYPNLDKKNNNIYNSLLKILNLSNKSILKENDFRFLIDFVIENKKSIFCFDYYLDINFHSDTYQINIILDNKNEDVTLNQIKNLFEFIISKLCENIMPICYKYIIKIKSSIC